MQNQSDSHPTGQVADECGLRSAACRSYAQVMGDVKADFNPSDECQAWFWSFGRSTNFAPRRSGSYETQQPVTGHCSQPPADGKEN
jgi:hypothetical protein